MVLIDLSRALNSASCKERKGNVYCCDYVVSIVVYISLTPIKCTRTSQTNTRAGLQPPSKWKLRIQGEAVRLLTPAPSFWALRGAKHCPFKHEL